MPGKKAAREQLDYGAQPRGRRRVRPHVRRAADRTMRAVLLVMLAWIAVLVSLRWLG